MKPYIICLLTILVFFGSCSELKEDTSQVLPFDEFLKTDEQANIFTAQAYAGFTTSTAFDGWIMLPAVVSDELIRLNRNDVSGWNYWLDLHRHFFDILLWENSNITAWNTLYSQIKICNQVIATLEESNFPQTVAPYIAELKVFRAFFYLQLIDLYGNVPILDTPDPFPCTIPRKEVFDFIEKSVLENIGLLSKETGIATYGRVNYYVAQAILAKLYLNAEIYSGTPAWEKAAAACDAIISSGRYSLSPDYFDNFKENRQNAPEVIFAALCSYDYCWLPPYTFSLSHWHISSLIGQPAPSFGAELAVPPDYYDTFEADDVRIKSFFEGPQFDAQGNPILDPDYEPADPDGPPINYTKDFDADHPLRQDGVRFGKFEIPTSCSSPDYINCIYSTLDFPVFRYADILLMKAEALERMGSNPNEVLSLVNTVRGRSNATPLSAITLDTLLEERGREFFLEGWRRSDLIRFGKFNDPWWEKPQDEDDHVNIFPIPQNNPLNSPCLMQNPGY